MIKSMSYMLVGMICLCFGSIAKTQISPVNNKLDSLAFWADVMINASMPEHREMANDQVYDRLIDLIHISRSPVSLPGNQWISAITPPDSSIRIYSWQLRLDDDNVKYYGLIQNLNAEEEWSVIELSDTRPFANAAEYADFSAESWYGALYYGIRDFELEDGGNAWLLIGFHSKDSRTNLKIAEILTIGNGVAKFGYPAFEPSSKDDGNDRKSRIIVEYADASAVSMQYDDSLGLLIYDHVVPIMAPTSPNGNEGPILISDGSYEAYRLNEGKWEYVEKVFDHIQDEPPRPFPILDNRKQKDLFGRERENP